MTMISQKSISFDASAKEQILFCFGKTVNEEGYIVEIEDPSQPVLTLEGDDILIDEFAGIRKGSEIFFKKDILSLIDLLDTIK